MTKLTKIQLTILSNAARREDGAAIPPERMNKHAAAKLAASLVARKLMREARAKAGTPVWRDDGDGRRFCLVVTRAGRDFAGVGQENSPPPSRGATNVVAHDQQEAKASAGDGREEPTPGSPPACAEQARVPNSPARPRPGSKQALLVDMLSKPGGTTINALVVAMGWLPHTTRAALTGLRKTGVAITRTPREKDASLYSIPAPAVDEPRKRGRRA